MTMGSYAPDFTANPTLEQLRTISRKGSGIEAVHVRPSTHPVNACMHAEMHLLFNEDLRVMGSIPEERHQKSKKESIYEAIKLLANKIFKTVKTIKIITCRGHMRYITLVRLTLKFSTN